MQYGCLSCISGHLYHVFSHVRWRVHLKSTRHQFYSYDIERGTKNGHARIMCTTPELEMETLAAGGKYHSQNTDKS